jgi:hypothetical protein
MKLIEADFQLFADVTDGEAFAFHRPFAFTDHSHPLQCGSRSSHVEPSIARSPADRLSFASIAPRSVV